MLGREGVVVSWTVVRVPPAGFSNLAPYPVAIVDFGGGGRMTAQIVDVPAPEDGQMKDFVGMKVRVIIRRIFEPSIEGVIPYGMKVKPI